jgi:hypothetical protein
MNKRAKTVPDMVQTFEHLTGMVYDALQSTSTDDSESVPAGESLPEPLFQYRLVTTRWSEVLDIVTWYSLDNERLPEWVEAEIIPVLNPYLGRIPHGATSYGMFRLVYPDGNWIVASSKVNAKTVREIAAIKSEDVHQDLKKVSELPVAVSSSISDKQVESSVEDRWPEIFSYTKESVPILTAKTPGYIQRPPKQPRRR